MSKRITKLTIYILSVTLVVIFSIQASFGFFDTLFSTKSAIINIGQWARLDENVTVSKVQQLIRNMYPDESDQDFIDYLEDIIFNKDDQGNPIAIDVVLSSYTIEEMINTINLIDEFTNNFLQYDSNNDVIYRESTNVSTIPIPLDSALLPGESVQINKVILTAEYANLNVYPPITLSLSISNASGLDISDYAIEVLVDSTPFNLNNPFQYTYDFRAGQNLTTVTSNTVRSNKNTLSTLTSYTEFTTEIIEKKTITTFLHRFELPITSGNWSRFPDGPEVYLTRPDIFRDSKRQNNLPGMLFAGSANGSKTQLNISIDTSTSVDGGSLPLIPIIIVLTRGQSNDGTVINLSNMPYIEMEVIKGTL